MQRSRVLLLRIVMIIAAYAGALSGAFYNGAFAQHHDQRSTMSTMTNPEPNSLLWLAVRPVGLRLGKSSDQRAMVQSVQAGGAADHAGLRQGDVLLHVGDLNAPSPDQTADQITNAWTAGKSAIDLVVSRAGNDLYVVLRLHG